MSTPLPGSSPRSVYSREELSPDGRWRVLYDYMDGEKSPLIVSPRIIETATNRVVVDLWRTCLDGSVHTFTATGFQIDVRDPYYPTAINTTIDPAAGTFFVHDAPTIERPLTELDRVLREIVERARQDYAARMRPPPPPPPDTLASRLARWLTRRS